MKSHQHHATSLSKTKAPSRTEEKKLRNSRRHSKMNDQRLYPLAKVLLVLRGVVPLRVLRLLHNLMNALPGKFKLISNKTKRFSAAMQIQNLGVSVGIRRRPWTQRSPLPVANLLQPGDAFGAQLSLAIALTQVTNPGAKRKKFTAKLLDMSGRDSTVTLSVNELIQGCNGEIETRDVVHVKDISKNV